VGTETGAAPKRGDGHRLFIAYGSVQQGGHLSVDLPPPHVPVLSHRNLGVPKLVGAPEIRAIFPDPVIVPAVSSKSSQRSASSSERRNPVAMNTMIGSTRSAGRGAGEHFESATQERVGFKTELGSGAAHDQACNYARGGTVHVAVRAHAPQSSGFTLLPLTILQNGKSLSPPPALKAMPLPPSTSLIVTKAPRSRNPLTTPP